MTEAPTALPSSIEEIRSKLVGVWAEVGSLVSFRDEPAFEMVMRLNQRCKGKLVSAIFTNNEDKHAAEASTAGGGAASAVVDRSDYSKESRLVFVPQAYESFLEDEMQKWLDPFHTQDSKLKQKRERKDDVVDDFMDEESDFDSNEVEYVD
uniref:Uncharacterized protein n=1 Tax=Trypanosoma congolense (strain IL3000) TaxID=1068625 RepID=G0UYG1_TRYCI|nr:conserved hypothetical protein [Trypanosoma congolense IL3000]